jgi:hypothetical protein
MKVKFLLSILASLIFKLSNCIRVLHIGVDGYLQKCKNKARKFIFDEFESKGSYTYKARTAIQTMSGPGWSNILCGLDSEMSGIVNNDWEAPWVYKQGNDITTLNNNEVLPCIMQQIKKFNPKLKTAYITDWEWFNNFSELSIPGSIDYDIYCNTDTLEDYKRCDSENLSKAKEIIMKKDFDYMFYYIGQVDEQGHSTGFCGDEYIKTLTVMNNIVESIFNTLKDAGIWEETVILWNTDHGANYDTHGHGYQNDDNLLVPWLIMGPGIKKGHEIEMNVKNLDSPATICKILGVPQNDLWKSRVVDEVFINNVNNEEILENNILEESFLGRTK